MTNDRPLRLNSRERAQLADDLVQLAFREIDLCGGAVGIEQAGAHRNGHLIQVADLAEYLIGRAAEADKATLLGQGAPIAQEDFLWRETSRECQRFLTRAAGECAAIGKARVVPAFVGKPEPTHVLDSVKRDSAGDVEAPAIVIQRRDMWLNVFVDHALSVVGVGFARLAQECEQWKKQLLRLLNIRYVPAVIQHKTGSAKCACHSLG